MDMDAPRLPPWVVKLNEDAKFVAWGEFIDEERKKRGDLDENGRVVSEMAKEEMAGRKAFNERLEGILAKHGNDYAAKASGG
jgi:hypothetical protein